MAPRVSRWAGAIALACAVVAVAFLPPRPEAQGLLRDETETERFGRDTRLPEERNRDRLMGHLSRAYADLKLGELRRGVARAVEGAPSPSGTPPRVIGTVRTPVNRRLELAFRGAWERIPRRSSGSPIVVVVYADSMYSRRTGTRTPGPAWYRSRYLFPADLDGRTCAVLWTQREGPVAPFEGPSDALGACTLFAEFGPPGPGVHRWLAARDHDVLWRVRGAFPAQTLRPVNVFDSLMGQLLAPIARTRQGIVLELALSVTASACCGGDVDACRRAMTDTSADYSKVRLGRWTLDPFGWRGPAHFAGLEETFLGDLRRQEGDERFEAFWTSSRPVEDAFHEAFGRDIGTWTLEWVVRNGGRRDRGPAPRARSAMISLLIALGVVAATVGTARWRRYEEPDRLSRQLGLPAP